MSADGDHQRTIEAVIAALKAKADDIDTPLEEWPGLFKAAAVITEESDDFRRAWLWGDEPSTTPEEAKRAAWARDDLEMNRCQEFSPQWDHRCELNWSDHHQDDLGRHHQERAETYTYFPTGERRTRQNRWVTPVYRDDSHLESRW